MGLIQLGPIDYNTETTSPINFFRGGLGGVSHLPALSPAISSFSSLQSLPIGCTAVNTTCERWSLHSEQSSRRINNGERKGSAATADGWPPFIIETAVAAAAAEREPAESKV